MIREELMTKTDKHLKGKSELDKIDSRRNSRRTAECHLTLSQTATAGRGLGCMYVKLDSK